MLSPQVTGVSSSKADVLNLNKYNMILDEYGDIYGDDEHHVLSMRQPPMLIHLHSLNNLLMVFVAILFLLFFNDFSDSIEDVCLCMNG